jgi:nitrite reductase (NADH) large subunit
MPKTVIIGNSTAAVSAAEEIRQKDPDGEVTLVCPEGVLPYDRTLLPSLASRSIKELQTFIRPEKSFRDQKINLVIDQPVTRISIKRKNIGLENKTQINFDKLLLVDPPVIKLPPIKGHNKEGVFDVYRLNNVKELAKQVTFVDHIIVFVTHFAGFEMACALSGQGKEIIIVTEGAGILTGIFDEETSSLLKQVVEGKGLRVIAGDPLVEILGDAQVKAVRLKSGKVIAAEMVILDQVEPDVRLLSESGLLENDAIAVKDDFKTLVSDVFVCAEAAGQYDLLPQESIDVGRRAAALLAGTESNSQSAISIRMFGNKVCDGFCGGILRLPEGGSERMQFDGPANIYKKIYLDNGHLAGAVWFNAPSDKDKVEQALIQQLTLAGNEEQFLTGKS